MARYYYNAVGVSHHLIYSPKHRLLLHIKKQNTQKNKAIFLCFETPGIYKLVWSQNMQIMSIEINN